MRANNGKSLGIETRMHDLTLTQVALFLAAAVVAAPLAKLLRVGNVLGYLLVGVLIGPYGLGLVYSLYEVNSVLHLAEFGVIMLLFVIGLELRPKRLWAMRAGIFGLGSAQVALTGLALAAAAMAFGLVWQAALFAGLALSLSSTAFALQILEEKGELALRHGRLAFSALLFQDLAAIPLIALAPLFAVSAVATAQQMELAAALKAIAIIIAVVVAGRYLLNGIYRLVARTRVKEAMTASALLTVVGVTIVMQQAGLPASLGAFIAGVLLADSEYRHEIESQIEPFKGLLLGLFFMAVGMSIDLELIAAEPLAIALGAVGLLAIKSVLLIGIGLRPAGMPWREALQLGAVLALGGEFAFVVLAESVKAGLIDAALQNRLVAVVGLSMALTPLSVIAVARLLARMPDAAPKREFDELPQHSAQDQPQVILAGFGRFGQIVARILVAQKIPFIALETNPEQLDAVRRFGNVVYFGDPAKPDLLRAAGAQHARIFINAIDAAEANLRTTRVVKRLYPHLKILARAHDRRHAWQLMDLGADVTRETFASGLEMGRDVLIALGVEHEVAVQRVQRFREHDEALLMQQHLIYDDDAALLESAKQARSELEQLFEADVGEKPAHS
jgi:glutathione-regulated potassium-efflux system protein KefB